MAVIHLPRLLDANNVEIGRVRPVSLSISERIVPLSTASMQLTDEEIFPGRSYVQLYTPNGQSAVYRSRMPTNAYGSGLNTVNLEHAICEVGDWVMTAKYENTNRSLEWVLESYWEYYRGSKWQLGTVSVEADVIVTEDFPNLLQAILSAIAQVPSAMMTFDFTTNPWTWNVVARDTTVSAEGRLSRNVQSATVTPDDSQLCTRVFLDGLGTYGGMSYMDADTQGTYGIVEKKLTNQDYTRSQAQAVASTYLSRYKRPIYSVQINGMDWYSITGEALDLLKVGKKYRLAIPDHNVTVEETITELNWTDVYGKPEAVTIQLNEDAETVLRWLKSMDGQQTSSVAVNVRDEEARSGIINGGSYIQIYVGSGADATVEDNDSVIYLKSDQAYIRVKSDSTGYATEINLEKNKITTQTGSGNNLCKLVMDGSDGSYKLTTGGTEYTLVPQDITVGGDTYKVLKLTT